MLAKNLRRNNMDNIEKICILFEQINCDEIIEGFRKIKDREKRLLLSKLMDLKIGLAQEIEVGRELF